MALEKYTRSIATHTSGVVDTSLLEQQLNADPAVVKTAGPSHTSGDVLDIWMSDTLLAAEEAAFDAALAAHDPTGYALKEEIKSIIYSTVEPPIVSTLSTSGLVITVDITDIIVNDQTTIVADTTDLKHVLVSFIHNSTTDVFLIVVLEYTTGAYAALAADETLVEDLKEYTVPANGTVLKEV